MSSVKMNEFQSSTWPALGEAFSFQCIMCMCQKVSGPDLGSWVGRGGGVLVLDHLWTLLFTETTSEPMSREERGVAKGEHPLRQHLSPSLSLTHTHTHMHTRLSSDHPHKRWSPSEIKNDDSPLTPFLMNLSSARGVRRVEASFYLIFVLKYDPIDG